MKKTKEEEDAEFIKTATDTVTFLDRQLDGVQALINYVIEKTSLSSEEISKARSNADEMIESLGNQTQFIGEILLSVCFCYDGSVRTMIDMINEKIKPYRTMVPEELAKHMFQAIKATDGSLN